MRRWERDSFGEAGSTPHVVWAATRTSINDTSECAIVEPHDQFLVFLFFHFFNHISLDCDCPRHLHLDGFYSSCAWLLRDPNATASGSLAHLATMGQVGGPWEGSDGEQETPRSLAAGHAATIYASDTSAPAGLLIQGLDREAIPAVRGATPALSKRQRVSLVLPRPVTAQPLQSPWPPRPVLFSTTSHFTTTSKHPILCSHAAVHGRPRPLQALPVKSGLFCEETSRK